MSVTPPHDEKFVDNQGHKEFTPYDNVSAVDRANVTNPLHGIPKEQLLADVDAFCTEYGMEDKREIFRKGALVAQRPDDFEEINELDEEDKSWFRRSLSNKWDHPKALYFAGESVSTAAVTLANTEQSLSVPSVPPHRDGTKLEVTVPVSSNATHRQRHVLSFLDLSFPAEFGIATPIDQPGGARDEWIVGFVNAAPYISSAFFGCWISDPLNHYFGRRGEVFITSLILIATPIASGFTHTWQELAAVRLVLGIGMGAKAATVPMYAAELAPANIRGALVMG